MHPAHPLQHGLGRTHTLHGRRRHQDARLSGDQRGTRHLGRQRLAVHDRGREVAAQGGHDDAVRVEVQPRADRALAAGQQPAAARERQKVTGQVGDQHGRVDDLRQVGAGPAHLPHAQPVRQRAQRRVGLHREHRVRAVVRVREGQQRGDGGLARTAADAGDGQLAAGGHGLLDGVRGARDGLGLGRRRGGEHAPQRPPGPTGDGLAVPWLGLHTVELGREDGDGDGGGGEGGGRVVRLMYVRLHTWGGGGRTDRADRADRAGQASRHYGRGPSPGRRRDHRCGRRRRDTGRPGGCRRRRPAAGCTASRHHPTPRPRRIPRHRRHHRPRLPRRPATPRLACLPRTRLPRLP